MCITEFYHTRAEEIYLTFPAIGREAITSSLTYMKCICYYFLLKRYKLVASVLSFVIVFTDSYSEPHWYTVHHHIYKTIKKVYFSKQKSTIMLKLSKNVEFPNDTKLEFFRLLGY